VLIGHQKIWQLLKVSYESDRLAHGYLFFGEERLGKRKLAKEFIKFLNCTGENPPCQICRSCKAIENEEYPDLSIIEPQNQDIQIEQIRELKYTLSLKAYEGKYKSVIINEAQALNTAAFSCLLKILEEPQGRTIMILISTARESLPKTILSRIEQIKFQKINCSEIEGYLKLQGIGEEKAKEMSLVSDGKPGAAMNYLNDPGKVEKEKGLIRDFIKIKKSSLAERFQYLKDLTEDENKNAVEVLKTWLGFLRSVLLAKAGVSGGNQIYSGFHKEVEDLNLLKTKKLLNICEDLNFLLSTTNANPKLALETLMMEL